MYEMLAAKMIADRRPKNVARLPSGIRSAIHAHQPEAEAFMSAQATGMAKRMTLTASALSPRRISSSETAAKTKPIERAVTWAAIQIGLRRRGRVNISTASRLKTELKETSETRIPSVSAEAWRWFLKKTLKICWGPHTENHAWAITPPAMLRFIARVRRAPLTARAGAAGEESLLMRYLTPSTCSTGV